MRDKGYRGLTRSREEELTRNFVEREELSAGKSPRPRVSSAVDRFQPFTPHASLFTLYSFVKELLAPDHRPNVFADP